MHHCLIIGPMVPSRVLVVPCVGLLTRGRERNEPPLVLWHLLRPQLVFFRVFCGMLISPSMGAVPRYHVVESPANTRRAECKVTKGYLHAPVQCFGVTHLLPCISTLPLIVLWCLRPALKPDNYTTFA